MPPHQTFHISPYKGSGVKGQELNNCYKGESAQGTRHGHGTYVRASVRPSVRPSVGGSCVASWHVACVMCHVLFDVCHVLCVRAQVVVDRLSTAHTAFRHVCVFPVHTYIHACMRVCMHACMRM